MYSSLFVIFLSLGEFELEISCNIHCLPNRKRKFFFCKTKGENKSVRSPVYLLVGERLLTLFASGKKHCFDEFSVAGAA